LNCSTANKQISYSATETRN